MAYAVAGLATASGGAISAEAEIHYSGLVNYKFNKESRGYEAHTFPAQPWGLPSGVPVCARGKR